MLTRPVVSFILLVVHTSVNTLVTSPRRLLLKIVIGLYPADSIGLLIRMTGRMMFLTFRKFCLWLATSLLGLRLAVGWRFGLVRAL